MTSLKIVLPTALVVLGSLAPASSHMDPNDDSHVHPELEYGDEAPTTVDEYGNPIDVPVTATETR